MIGLIPIIPLPACPSHGSHTMDGADARAAAAAGLVGAVGEVCLQCNCWQRYLLGELYIANTLITYTHTAACCAILLVQDTTSVP